ncbi:MAG: M23 family metallopeptidase [Bacteroidales bacterium]|nr:M23 family metallopeptidase [Bacteroidales bacterium]
MTLKTGGILLLWLLTQTPTSALPRVRKDDPPPTVQNRLASLTIVLPPEPSSFNPLDHPPFSCRPVAIVPIVDDCRALYFDDLLEEYDVWNESLVNPYGIRLVDMTDTIKIDMRGYVPPTLKYVTSDFGFRRGQFHYGIDLKVHRGDSVYCAFDGQVRITLNQRRGYGQYVVVRHNNGLETLYAHLSKTLVKPGQIVKAGEVLGLGGNTGRSTGYHLHFETRYLGNVINPNDLYDFEQGAVKNEVFFLSAKNFEYVKEVEKIRFWTVRKGDSLSRIAARTGVSVSKLCALNNIKSTSVLRIGQRIRYT